MSINLQRMQLTYRSVTSIDAGAAASIRLYHSQMQQVAGSRPVGKTQLPEAIYAVLLFQIELHRQ